MTYQPPSGYYKGYVPKGRGWKQLGQSLGQGMENFASQWMAIKQYEAEKEEKRLKAEAEENQRKIDNTLKALHMENLQGSIAVRNMEMEYYNRGEVPPWKQPQLTPYQAATLPGTTKIQELTIEEKQKKLDDDTQKYTNELQDDVLKWYSTETTNIAKNTYNLPSGAIDDYKSALHEIMSTKDVNALNERYNYWYRVFGSKSGGTASKLMEKLTDLKIRMQNYFNAGGQQITEPQYQESYELPGTQGFLSPDEFRGRLDEAMGLIG